jgi:hypothetical protein
MPEPDDFADFAEDDVDDDGRCDECGEYECVCYEDDDEDDEDWCLACGNYEQDCLCGMDDDEDEE